MDTYVFGYTGFSKKVAAMFEADGFGEFKGFILDRKFICEGDEVIAWEDFVQYVKPTDCNIIVTVGYTHMNDARCSVISKLHEAGYTAASYISRTAVVSPTVEIEEGCVILQNCLVEPYAKLGIGNILDSCAFIAHDTVVGNYNWFGVGSVTLGGITLGNNCFIGANATLRDGITISDRTLIGAGAFVNKSTSPRQVIVPARSVMLEKTSDEISI